MTEIKKGTPVWIWNDDDTTKVRAIYCYYDNLSKSRSYRHLVFREGSEYSRWEQYAEPINEKEEAMKRIAEAEANIAEAKKLLNAL